MNTIREKVIHALKRVTIESKLKKPTNTIKVFKDFKVEFEEDNVGIHHFIAYKDDDLAGELQIVDDAKGFEGKPYVLNVLIEAPYRRQGLADFMYDWAEEIYREDLIPAVDQTPDAIKFWEDRRNKKKNK